MISLASAIKKRGEWVMKSPGGIKHWLTGFVYWRQERRRQRQEFIKEFMQEHMEYHRRQQEFRREHPHEPHEFHPRHYEFHRQHQLFIEKHREFQRYHRRLKYTRPLILLFNLVIWYLIFRYLGVKTISVIFAILISSGGIYEIFFLQRLEKRVFDPIEKLKNGVEEIAKGNYNVQIECEVFNDLTLLVASFNDMARKLQESEKMKVGYEENRKALLANISHDLKTPITSIQGYIEALLDRTDISGEDRDKYLQIIYRNTAYMNKLIEDLFLFSKLDMEKLEFKFENIPVRDFMNDLMEEFRLELEEKQIRFDYNDHLETECMINIDRKRIYQAVRNIIGNAVKYGPEKGLSIEINTSRQDAMVAIDIRDNGPGIAPDKLPFIFDRFYRIDTERTKDVISTGLGLAIARELVTGHNGEIAVTSVLGAGSCFTIKLPVLVIAEGRELTSNGF
jgi:signal transduction histidine kinase